MSRQPQSSPPQLECPSPPRPTWPVVIGILSIALALDTILRTLPYSFTMTINFHITAGLMVLAREALPSLLLLVAGVLLLRARPTARVLYLIYAPLKILLLLSPLVYDLYKIWTRLPVNWLQTRLVAKHFYPVAAILFPIFLLVWFSRRKIKEDLRAMRRERHNRELSEPRRGSRI